MKISGQNRATLLALAGGYMIYLAWDIWHTWQNGGTTMAGWTGILFAVFFLAAGVAVLIFAWKVWRKSRKEEERKTVETDGNETHLTKD